MPRATARLPFVLVLALLGAACGKKGPPLAPYRPMPARVTEINVRRLGDRVHLQFTLPVVNTDQRGPADLDRVEVYGFTGAPVDELGRPLDLRGLRREATLVATLQVKPPPLEGEEEAPVERLPDDLPEQGHQVTVVDTLGPEAFTPIDLTARRRKGDDRPKEPEPDLARFAPLVAPVFPLPITRLYVIVGVSSHGDSGPEVRTNVSLADNPLPPAFANVCYTQGEICIEWAAPASLRQRVQRDRGDDQIAARGIFFQSLTPTAYNVYEVTRSDDGTVNPIVKPLNDTPLTTPPFAVKFEEFGAERCFVVTSVDAVERNVWVESPVSTPACVTLQDIFPPVAPRGLAAVGSEGSISLIWEANEEPDLAGYIVLRGEAPGETLQPLMATPIKDTTYRDATARPGVRYVYAVVAVDDAEPPNMSERSGTVEESAR